jgi:hypothetical protein
VTTSQIIACAIGWTAAIVAITALVSVRRARRQPVRWETDGGMVTFDRKLTDSEVEEFKTRWLERHGKPGVPPSGPAGASSANAQACGCWNGVRCVKHCTCRQCTALRRTAASREEQPGA